MICRVVAVQSILQVGLVFHLEFGPASTTSFDRGEPKNYFL